jgi:hypothetical protein
VRGGLPRSLDLEGEEGDVDEGVDFGEDEGGETDGEKEEEDDGDVADLGTSADPDELRTGSCYFSAARGAAAQHGLGYSI